MRTRSTAVVASSAIASLIAAAGGCTDRAALPSAPRSVVPTATVYTATANPPVSLGSLAGTLQDMAIGINSAGDVTGVSAGRVVLWPTGTAVAPASIAPTPIDFGRGMSINAAGQIAGEYGNQAALWTPDGFGGYVRTVIGAQLPQPSTSTATEVNAAGKVVGSFRMAAGGGFIDGCYLWTPSGPNATTGAVTIPANDLGGGTFCVASDINSAGTITGASVTLNGLTHAFVWDGVSALVDLTPGSPALSYGTAINDGGQVAGTRPMAVAPFATNAAIWTPTGPSSYSVQDLGTFGRDESQPEDINDAGFVVAFGRNNTTFLDDAFFWQNGFSTPLPGVPGYVTEPAGSMNNLTNTGVVIVVGVSANPVTNAIAALRWAVTLTPVTQQGCLATLVSDVDALAASGTLRSGEAKSLLAKLDAVARQIDQGNKLPAANILNAFINEVNALVVSNGLTSAQGRSLINGAQCAIDAL